MEERVLTKEQLLVKEQQELFDKITEYEELVKTEEFNKRSEEERFLIKTQMIYMESYIKALETRMDKGFF